MAESLEFYVDVLRGSTSGLSAVAALKSLDDAAARATAGIRSLEDSYAKANAELSSMKAPASLKALEDRLAAVKDANKRAFIAGDTGQLAKLGKEKVALEEKVAKARESAAAKVSKQEEKIVGISSKLAAARNAQAASASLDAAKRNLAVKGLDEQVSKFGQLSAAAKEAGVPGAGLVDKLAMLAKAGPAAAAFAVAAALLAIAAAAVVAAAAVAKYALAAADAARSSRLLSDAATGSVAGGKELEAVVSELTSAIPQNREQIAGWARDLNLAGLAGRDMQRTLIAMGTVSAAVGDQAAGKIKGIAEASRTAQRFILGARDRFGEFASLQGTGIKAADIYAAVARSMKTSIPEAARMVNAGIVPLKKGLAALEDAAQTKFGPIVARQMMSLSVLGKKLSENFTALFADVDIEPFLAGLKSIVDLFDQNTVMGYALKTVLGEAFTWIFAKASTVFPYIRAFMLGVALAAILVATVVKRVATTISRALGLDAKKSLIDVEYAFYAGAGAIAVVVAALVGLAAVWLVNMAAMAISAAIAWAPMILGAAVLGLVVYGLYQVSKAAGELWDELKDVDLAKIAGDIMDGLVKGIKAKISAVKDAIGEVSSAITSVFASDQEIRSPGKKAMRQGRDVVRGHALGIEQEIPRAERVAGDLSGAVSGGMGQGGANGSTRGGLNAEKIELHFHVAEPGDLPAKVREVVVSLMLGEARGSAVPA